MASVPTIYADFNNIGNYRRLLLNCVGTKRDLTRFNIQLQEGMELCFSDGELIITGIVTFSQEENMWAAIVDWDQVRDVNP